MHQQNIQVTENTASLIHHIKHPSNQTGSGTTKSATTANKTKPSEPQYQILHKHPETQRPKLPAKPKTLESTSNPQQQSKSSIQQTHPEPTRQTTPTTNHITKQTKKRQVTQTQKTTASQSPNPKPNPSAKPNLLNRKATAYRTRNQTTYRPQNTN